jgi:hypothetical protein
LEICWWTLGFERQTIYRCIRRITGYEPGSAYHDLEDIGSGELRRRGDGVTNAAGAPVVGTRRLE